MCPPSPHVTTSLCSACCCANLISPRRLLLFQLMPEYMNDAGYESHMVGKWHLGSHTDQHTPHRRGFKTFLGYLNGEATYWTHKVGRFRPQGDVPCASS